MVETPYFKSFNITAMLIAATCVLLLNGCNCVPRIIPGYPPAIHAFTDGYFGWPFAAYAYAILDQYGHLPLVVCDALFGAMCVYVTGRVAGRFSTGPSRQRFQTRLSTALLLTLLVGTLACVEFTPHLYVMELGYTSNWACGWPVPDRRWWGVLPRRGEHILWPGVCYNAVTAIMIVLTAWRVLELRIQRKLKRAAD